MEEDDFTAIHPDKIRKVEVRHKIKQGEKDELEEPELADIVPSLQLPKYALTFVEFNKNSPLLQPKISLNQL